MRQEFDTSDTTPWVDGIGNVFFVQYKEQCNNTSEGKEQILVPNPIGLLCFLTQQYSGMSRVIIQQPTNCYHHTVWYALLTIQKGLTKLICFYPKHQLLLVIAR